MRKIDPAVLGKWVKEHRKLRKITQEELAAAAGITRYQLIRIENGESKTTRETASALAVALEQNEGEALRLAGYDGEPTPTISREEAELLSDYRSVPETERRKFLSITKATSQALAAH